MSVHSPSAHTHRDAELPVLDLSEVRRRAWETRRAKYGDRGHAGSYSRGASESGAVLMIIKLHAEGVLSEGQVAQSTGLDRVEIRRRREAVEELAALSSLAVRQATTADSVGTKGEARSEPPETWSDSAPDPRRELHVKAARSEPTTPGEGEGL